MAGREDHEVVSDANCASSSSASSSVRQSSSRAPSRMRPITGTVVRRRGKGFQPGGASGPGPDCECRGRRRWTGCAAPIWLLTASTVQLSPAAADPGATACARFRISSPAREQPERGISLAARSGSPHSRSVAAQGDLVDAERAAGFGAASMCARDPTTVPHCGPPESLSPENSTRSAPREGHPVQTFTRTVAGTVEKRADPRSQANGNSWRAATSASVSMSTSCVKPATSKLLGAPHQHARPAWRSRSPGRVRFVPTRPGAHRPDASPLRKAPPISTSSPREPAPRQREGIEHEEYCGCTVVDHCRGFSAGQCAQQRSTCVSRSPRRAR